MRRVGRRSRVAALGLCVVPIVAAVLGAAQPRVTASDASHHSGHAAPPRPPLSFARDIRPILSNHCFACHGPDEAARQGDLRLDTHEGASAALTIGDPDRSLLIRRVTSADPELRMPPVEVSAHGLSNEQVALLRRWIAEGAPWGEHWSFVPPEKRPLPSVSAAEWIRQPLDAWVLASLEALGHAPAPEADRRTLLRRAWLDLVGLPPSPEQVRAFLEDTRPDAYERVVDELLASAHFGEKWARWWLDLARYADTKGYEKDDRRTMWPYRDWVIRAFNENLPFDRFTLLQLAGDMVPDPSLDDLVATAFHRNTMTNDEGGTDDEEYRMAAVVDRVNTTFEIWQGLTMACAQCHTHKYDPITHTEYFQVAAIFNNTEDADGAPAETPLLPLPSDAERAALAELDAEIARLTAALADEAASDAATGTQDEAAPEMAKGPVIEKADGATLEAQLAERRKAREAVQNAIVKLPVMRELQGNARRVTHRLSGGSHLAPLEAVEPGVPAFLVHDAGAATAVPRTRLELAEWLFAPENPLTARTIVNRVWEQLWGQGLAPTLEDLGTQGTWPTHLELLDALAIAFRDGAFSGAPGDTPSRPWDFKALLREIVTSATYRQSSRPRDQETATHSGTILDDPDNTRLARGPRVRLDAETIRDQALAASGLLSSKMFGPPVFPYQPPGLWIMIYSGDRWTQSTGEDAHRRSLYTFLRRTVPHPAMTTFDAPSREVCVSRRIRTNTPLQAMVTLNDPQFVEAAQALARLALRTHEEDAVRCAFMMERVLCRPPQRDELDSMMEALHEFRARFAAAPDDAVAAATDPLGPLDAGSDPVEVAAWSVLASVVLNLDEALTRE